jgi:hypothetical protein
LELLHFENPYIYSANVDQDEYFFPCAPTSLNFVDSLLMKIHVRYMVFNLDYSNVVFLYDNAI